VSVEINHLVVPATEKITSAQFLGDILGLAAGEPVGHVQPVQIGAMRLFYDDEVADICPMHIALLVDDDTFDAAHQRLLDAEIPIYADLLHQQPDEINHRRGRRVLYFDDPDGHLFELMTPVTPAVPVPGESG
jgi:catechol 2,3-dioxygenase-like lactoylglutathione lyase family enzyme